MFDRLRCVTLALTVSVSLAYLSHTQIQRLPAMSEWFGHLFSETQTTWATLPNPRNYTWILHHSGSGYWCFLKTTKSGCRYGALGAYKLHFLSYSRADTLSFMYVQSTSMHSATSFHIISFFLLVLSTAILVDFG